MGRIFIGHKKEILSDFRRVENYRILEDRCMILLIFNRYYIQILYLHFLGIETVEGDFIKEDFIDWEILYLNLQQE
jgi:hypothetical protein